MNVEGQPRRDRVDELVDTVAPQRRDAERGGIELLQPPALVDGHGVALVVDVQRRNVGRADFLEHLVDRVDTAVAVGRRRVDDVQHEVGFGNLLERGAERGNQRVGEAIDEPDRVRHEQFTAVRQANLPDQRIQRDEECVGRLGVRPCQRVEQRRLACVRVADQRDGRHRPLVAALAQLRPPATHGLDVFADRMDASPDPPPVGLELRFARAAGADAAAKPR